MIGFALMGYGVAALICFVFSLLLRPLLKIEPVKEKVDYIIDAVCDFLIYGPLPKMTDDKTRKP